MNFFGIFLLALLASLAEVEAQKISDRTKTGMVRANAKGAFLFLVSSPDLEWIERQ
jgi:DNA invertase Pin-like site-specific DNA recombinase